MRTGLIGLLTIISYWAFSQSLELTIVKSNSAILLDGVLDEPAWKTADSAHSFYQNFPYDTSYALTKTSVFTTYDDNFLYIAAICYDNLEGDYVIQSLKRDFSYPVSDAFAVFLDPYNDGMNGFSFSVNPEGVQREGLLVEGGGFGVTTAWDNKWYSEVQQYRDKWIVEMAIPFKTLRFNENVNQWHANFSRNDLKRNENSSWAPVPRNFNIATMAFSGLLKWDKAPPKPKTNISIIPYAIAGISKDYEAKDSTVFTPNAGVDIKVAITSSLNLDLTFNPDFSQVEVDRQVTNLSRFSLFFPERRNFFLENDDLFSNYGFRQIRPFFSRRIGLAAGQQIPILGGARLSGKLNQNWRIGFLNMQTEGVGELDLASYNWTMGAIQRKVFKRSFISGIFVNKLGFDGVNANWGDYNRVAGMDFNFASEDNRFRGKTFYHQSFSPEMKENAFAHATWFNYSDQNWMLMHNHEYVGHNYNAEVGFVPRVTNYDPINERIIRKSYWRFEPMIRYRFYPKSKIINYHGPSIYLSEYTDSLFKSTERNLVYGYAFMFQNSSAAGVNYSNDFVRLFFDLDITNTESTPIPQGDYHFNYTTAYFQSNPRKLFTYYLEGTYGTFYNGIRLNFNSTIQYRFQPYGSIAITADYNKLKFPDPYGKTELFLLGPKIDLSMSKKLFLTAFFQYNTQQNNFNINTRFQYRFKPMSDIFLVYTDNYFADILAIRNRAVVLKFVYWFTA